MHTLLNKIDKHILKRDDFNMKTPLINNIISNINKNNMIGEGALGKVYIVGKYAIKNIIPCNIPSDKPLYQYCKDLLSFDKLPFIPGGNGKYRYLLPNLLTEITIGMLLNNISFSKTIGSTIYDGNVNIIMKRYNQLPDLVDALDFTQFLFQMAHGLLNVQQSYQFTHYDLHLANVLAGDWPKNKAYISYPLPNKNINIKLSKMYCPFIYKIADFGLSRMEINNIIISSTMDQFPIKSYGEFNPFYDFACLLGSMIIKYQLNLELNVTLYQFILNLMLWYFNEPPIKKNDNLNNIKNKIMTKYYTIDKKGHFTYRPKMENGLIPYLNTQFMVNVVNYLANVLLSSGKVEMDDTFNTNTIYIKNLSPYTIYPNIILYQPNLSISSKPNAKNSINQYESMQIDKYITVTKYYIKWNAPPNAFNFTLEDQQIKNCPIQEHYVSTILVEKEALNDYQFSYDCCKIDAVNYLLEKNRVGFVVNGGFFSIKNDYLPIGLYKDDYNIINKYDIPKKYKDVFGYIVLENNQLKITRIKNNKTNICSTGPILIEDGKIVFKQYDRRFMCTDDKHSKELMLQQDDKTITLSGYYKYKSINNECVKKYVPLVQTFDRCDKIEPGELSHAGNPNPRSAFCMLDNGNYVFVAFEGRSSFGYGIDLFKLAQSIKLTLPNVVSAIALDGGRSVVHAFKSKKSENIYITNAGRDYYYPAGSIISLLKI